MGCIALRRRRSRCRSKLRFLGQTCTMEACGGVGRLARHREHEVERPLGELVEGAVPELAEHARARRPARRRASPPQRTPPPRAAGRRAAASPARRRRARSAVAVRTGAAAPSQRRGLPGVSVAAAAAPPPPPPAAASAAATTTPPVVSPRRDERSARGKTNNFADPTASRAQMEANWVGGKAPEKPAPTKPIEERSFMRATTSREYRRRRAGVGVGQLYSPRRASACRPAAPARRRRPQAPPPASQSPKTAQVA